MALDDALADRIALRSVVHKIPCAVGDLAGVLDRRRLPQALDQQQLRTRCTCCSGEPGGSLGSASPVTSRHMPVATSRRLRRVTDPLGGILDRMARVSAPVMSTASRSGIPTFVQMAEDSPTADERPSMAREEWLVRALHSSSSPSLLCS